MLVSKIRKVLYRRIVRIIPSYYRLYGCEIADNVKISRKARIETNIYPQGIHIGEFTQITGGVRIISHDACRALKADTYIGANCFIGINSLILPGVRIGDNVVIGSGSVVTKDIPSNSIAAGNPAKVIRSDVKIGRYGRILE